MDTWQRISGVLFLSVGSLSLVDVGALQAQSGTTVPGIQAILSRMAQTRVENRTHLRPYSVVRDYKLFGKENQTTKAEVIADVTFVPPDHNQARGIRMSLRSTIPRGQSIQVSG